MKIFKSILIALAIILAISFTGIYFLPNHYIVSNSIEIDKPAAVVYSQISNYNNWGSWSPWQELEPTAKHNVEGTPGSPGHKMSWEGNKIGSGSITLDAAIPNQSITSELDFVKPFKASAKDNLKLETMGGKTKVTWTNTGGLSYPFGRLFGLRVDRTLGGQQKQGLENLKKFCEAIPAATASADSTSVADKPM